MPLASRSKRPPAGRSASLADAERLERQRRQHRPAVAELDVDRVVRRGGRRAPPASAGDSPRTAARSSRRRRSATRPASSCAPRRGCVRARLRASGAPIQLTSVLKLSAARMACRCESMSPGMTVRPPRSMTRVAGPASFRTSSDEPTRSDASIAIASACATVDRASSVTILPFRRMVSGVCARALTDKTQRTPRRRRWCGYACRGFVRSRGGSQPDCRTRTTGRKTRRPPRIPSRAAPAACRDSRG